MRTARPALLAATLLAATTLGAPATAAAPLTTYRVTLANATGGQPFSPPVLTTHRPGATPFRVGQPASTEVEAVAENGDNAPLAAALTGLPTVTAVAALGAPVGPGGAVTVELEARPGDRLSVVTMLVCTNDGITGLSAARLPDAGTTSFDIAAYDAGSEANTELSEDIVDPCLGPDGNRNDVVDTDGVIHHHPGIAGTGDLDPAVHGWTGPVGSVTVEVVG